MDTLQPTELRGIKGKRIPIDAASSRAGSGTMVLCAEGPGNFLWYPMPTTVLGVAISLRELESWRARLFVEN